MKPQQETRTVDPLSDQAFAYIRSVVNFLETTPPSRLKPDAVADFITAGRALLDCREGHPDARSIEKKLQGGAHGA